MARNTPSERGAAARTLVHAPADARHGLGGKVIGVANAGRPVRVGVALPDCRHHFVLLGPTGTGKSTLMLNMALDDATAGRGLAVFDPAKGDLVTDLLDRLPPEAGDRLVIVDPDERQAPPSLNLLDAQVGGGSPHHVAAHVSAVMAKVWSRWWGDRMSEVAYHGLLTLAHLPNATLADLPRLLGDRRWRAPRVRAVLEALGAWQAGTLAEFWEGFDGLPAGQRASLVAPLLSRLRLVLAHPLAAALFGAPATTFTLSDVLDGGILLARLPKGELGEDGTRLIGSLLLAGLWQATTARARIREDQRLDATIYLDEAHNFLHLPIGVEDALAEARGLRTSWVLAHQYLGQLSSGMAAAEDANARNKVYFALAPDDATDQARHLRPWLDDGDLIRLGAFEVALRPVSNARAIAPVTATTLPAPRPVAGRAAGLRQAARRRTGLAGDARRRLRFEVARPSTPDVASAAPRRQPPGVGRNTFTEAVAASRGESSNERSNERSHHSGGGSEQPGEQPPLGGWFAQAGGDEPDAWSGTD